MPRLKAALVPLFLATALVPATLAAQTTNGAVPGSLNFIQGQANIDGQPLDANNPSTQPHQLQPGQTLATANGSADILLAPGALLRIGNDTTVRMVAGDNSRTEVRLEQGRGNVSVNVVRHDHLLLIDMPNGQTQILSKGLYTFNTATNTMRVFNGEAYAFPGTDMASDIKPVKVKESHEIILGGDRAKPDKFDREMADNDLLPWTGPKEAQAVVANNGAMYNGDVSYSSAGYYGGASGFYGGSGFYGPYAFGDPYYAGYPYGGWGPYGFYGYPFFGVGFGYWGGGFYRGGAGFGSAYNHGGYPIHGPVRGGAVSGVRGGYTGHSVSGGSRSFSGGGFSGGGRGFGGGGLGGAIHGGGGHR